ncbi:hypothetical protein SAMN02745830_01067 [Streptomyces sp. Amel2xC10]|nr:hypothetical protein SAMN02745830_01067 [Streptomyces sp. Amel2xC10]
MGAFGDVEEMCSFCDRRLHRLRHYARNGPVTSYVIPPDELPLVPR